MFEKDLLERLQRIFDFKDVSFDEPSESQEQEKLFIRVDEARCNTKDARQVALVTGDLWVFAPADKLPFGYFAKRIARAAFEDTSKFIFHAIDKNMGVRNNIVRRSVSFVFFFEAQYDPAIGEITEVTIDVES